MKLADYGGSVVRVLLGTLLFGVLQRAGWLVLRRGPEADVAPEILLFLAFLLGDLAYELLLAAKRRRLPGTSREIPGRYDERRGDGKPED